ncbi:MAG: type IX secretion system membrane protein PorP/SprF [Saprospiraceae bacterium]|nr:type IX secretion system membrane protein PorP/SprF [Saprospiraceae bacterium]
MRLREISIGVLFFLLTYSIYGQDPIYSQFFNSPTLINPAFAGNTRGAFVSVNYRNQWPSIENAYETFSLTYDQRWNKSSGVGLYLTTDAAGNGALKTTKLGGIYSYRIRIRDEVFVKGAIDVAYGQTRLDQSKLVFLDNLDPQFGLMTPGGVSFPTQEIFTASPSRSYLDVSSGVLLYTPGYYAGLSFKHLNSPNIDFVDDLTGEAGILPIRWSFIGGGQINLDRRNNGDDGTFISPNVLFVKQQDFWQLNVGAYINVLQMFGGLWYRQTGSNGDSVIASFGVKTGIYKIGYSFDYTISGLTIGSGGSHEVGIAINFDKLLPKESKYNDCLMLFR